MEKDTPKKQKKQKKQKQAHGSSKSRFSSSQAARRGLRLHSATSSKSTKAKRHLLDLVEAGNVEKVSQLLSSDPQLFESVNKTGELLLRACERGLLDMAALLLRHKVDVNDLGDHELAPLHVAVKRGHMTVIALLLSHKASVNVCTRSEKRSPLHLAAIMGQDHVTRILLQNDADVNRGDIYGNTALHLASQLGRKGVVSVLLDYGADVNIYDNGGWTGLLLASEAGQVDVIQLLVRHYADIHRQNKYGRTALHWAVIGGKLPVVRQLLDADADVQIRDVHEKTPLDYCKHAPIKKLLQFYGKGLASQQGAPVAAAVAPLRRGNSVLGELMTDLTFKRCEFSDSSDQDSAGRCLSDPGPTLHPSTSAPSLNTERSEADFQPALAPSRMRSFLSVDEEVFHSTIEADQDVFHPNPITDHKVVESSPLGSQMVIDPNTKDADVLEDSVHDLSQNARPQHQITFADIDPELKEKARRCLEVTAKVKQQIAALEYQVKAHTGHVDTDAITACTCKGISVESSPSKNPRDLELALDNLGPELIRLAAIFDENLT